MTPNVVVDVAQTLAKASAARPKTLDVYIGGVCKMIRVGITPTKNIPKTCLLEGHCSDDFRVSDATE